MGVWGCPESTRFSAGFPRGDRHPRSPSLANRKEPIYMTRAKFVGLSAVLLALALLVAPLRAAEEAKPSGEGKSGKAFVVLVGVSNYADKHIKPRPHAEEDVQALYDLFTNKDYLGVDKDHIRLLLGSGADPKRDGKPATK